MSTYVLYNELSGNGTGKEKAQVVNKFLTGKEIVYQDVTKISDYKTFFEGLNADDELVLCGGDGTLNRFINDTDGLTFTQPLSYYPTGSGNDFWNDLGKGPDAGPERIEQYIKDLPFVEVNGMKKRFINGIGVQAYRMMYEGKLPPITEATSLGDVICGTREGRVSEDERICFVTGGLPVWDVGWSYEVYCRAREMGLGVELKLWDSPYLN